MAPHSQPHLVVYRGRCKYKSGKCANERSVKDNGLPHTLCEPHRVQHNKNQRKSDVKRRRQMRLERGGSKTRVPAKPSTTDETWTLRASCPSLQSVEDALPADTAAASPASILEPFKWNDDWSVDDLILLRDVIM
ncbi:hypothetical protein DYB32_005304 [Aphanomyces invadans]|uniref:Uncharacterized protein n=1 Tax=Aphanomyces invadans TaxID=157072 RepID=A0A3R7A8G3_9STRA|nr:hypothetical protein DYB32_005304 [Aphanomyces invadans]